MQILVQVRETPIWEGKYLNITIHILQQSQVNITLEHRTARDRTLNTTAIPPLTEATLPLRLDP